VVVTLTCADNEGGSGCASGYPKYCTDTDNSCDPTTSYTAPVTVSTENTSYIRYYSVDEAENTETTNSSTINIDISAPTNVGILSISADSTTQLTITGLTATDSGAGLHATPYQFQETSGNDGATSSDWQVSDTYTDSGLSPNTQYTYKVRAKDAANNISDYSSTSSKYTLAAVPGTPSLTTDSSTQISASWSANSNPSGTQYYIENTTASTNSGWITDTSWESSGLTCNTSYNFRVKARNGDGTETDYSATASVATSACPSAGGGGLPAAAFLPPTAPPGGFQVLINGGSPTTTSQDVTLTLRGSSETIRMSVSNDLNFANAVQEPYDIIKQWKLSDGYGQKTIYVKFFTGYGVASNTISATISYQAQNILTPIINIITPPTPQNPPEIPPIPPQPPAEEVVPEQAPESMQNVWNLLPTQAISQFVLNPVPKEITDLTNKFPELSKTLEAIGVSKITDVSKLVDNTLILPNISEIINPPEPGLQPGQVAVQPTPSPDLVSGQVSPFGGIPLQNLTELAKQVIPTEILFAKSAGGLVDYNTTLSLSQQGHPQQQLQTIVNQPIQLIVRPDKPARAIRGYFVFKQSSAKPSSKINASKLTASLLQQEIDINQIRKSTELKQALVLSVFDFEDLDKDGVWTADVVTPPVDGQYDIFVVIDYRDQRLLPKELSLVAVVDPEGYVYTKIDRGELRINNAKVSLYWLNPQTNNYQLWPAKDFQQVNPQITDSTGRYSFLVPEGTYYLTAEAQGYIKYQGSDFVIKSGGNGVHFNIELRPQNWWMQFIDWKTVVIIALVLFIIYIIKINKLKLKK